MEVFFEHGSTSSQCTSLRMGEEEGTKYVIPLSVDEKVSLVPDEILKVYRCGCSSENSCKSGNCSCNKSRIPCSTFCECEEGVSCRNPFNARPDEDVCGTEEYDVLSFVLYSIALVICFD